MTTKDNKTNVMRILDQDHVKYKPLYYDFPDRNFSGELVSELLGLSPAECFKSLCARGKDNAVFVFVIPVSATLDLKKAAQAAGEKNIVLVAVKELRAVTGYERGSVCPVGLKKAYPVFIDSSALQFDEIELSGGAKGASIKVAPQDLASLLTAAFVDLL